MNPRILLPIVAFVLCAVSLIAFATDRKDQVAGEGLPDFSGKTVLVYTTKDPHAPTWVMVKSRLNKIGDRFFLSGKYAETGRKEDWRSGLATNVAWDSVTAYHVFSTKEYEKFRDNAQVQGF